MNRKNPNKQDVFVMSVVVIILVTGAITFFLKNDLLIKSFNLIVIFSGFCMFISIFRSMITSISSKFWDKLEYEVVETRFDMQMQRGDVQTQYHPFFKIEYTKNGEVFTRTSEEDLNLSIGRVFYTPHDAQKYLDQVCNYSYGNTVYVNPKNPKIAYLRFGVGRDQLGMFVFSLFLIILPILTLSGLIEWR